MASVARDIRKKATAPLRPVRLGKLDPVIEQRAGGVIYIRAAQELGPYHDKLSQPLSRNRAAISRKKASISGVMNSALSFLLLR